MKINERMENVQRTLEEARRKTAKKARRGAKPKFGPQEKKAFVDDIVAQFRPAKSVADRVMRELKRYNLLLNIPLKREQEEQMYTPPGRFHYTQGIIITPSVDEYEVMEVLSNAGLGMRGNNAMGVRFGAGHELVAQWHWPMAGVLNMDISIDNRTMPEVMDAFKRDKQWWDMMLKGLQGLFGKKKYKL